MTDHVESEERLNRSLIRLAKKAGVATSYFGLSGDWHEIADDVLIAVLDALGVDAVNDYAIEQSLEAFTRKERERLVAPTILHIAGQESTVRINTSILDVPIMSITLEDGSQYQGKVEPTGTTDGQAFVLGDKFIAPSLMRIPADLPKGYHTLHVTVGDRQEDATLISVPSRVPLPEPLEKSRWFGWMAQLYSIRSEQSWGVGDYADLKQLLVDAKKRTGADFVLINPMHAAEPVPVLTPSPYLPVSRRFVNFTYIRPESIPEYETLDETTREKITQLHESVDALNEDAQVIDRDTMWKAKSEALWLIFKAGLSQSRQDEFYDFVDRMGDDLNAYATWCLCYDKWGAPSTDRSNWERTLGWQAPQVVRLCEQYPDTFDFYRWLEWIAVSQFKDAQQAAKDAGMTLGIMADMAVGVHPLGSDVWWKSERFARGATVGAPPDYFNQQGQDWSQPPLSPLDLERTGYKAYRDIVQSAFSQAGALRIDHILGLFRLWWIPEGKKPTDGTYVYYDSAVMLGILALEAERAGGVIVGEDLGVVPDYVRDSLASHGIMGCAVEWFEQMDGKFTPPKQWREYALASVNTHDLPPCAGYLQYDHVALRERLGLLTGSVDEFMELSVREHNAMMTMLVDEGYLDPSLLDNESEHIQEIIEALYRALADSPCKLIAGSITDAVGERRTQNQPGTNNEYPNWRIPLADGEGNPVMLETLFERDSVQRLARVMRGEE